MLDHAELETTAEAVHETEVSTRQRVIRTILDEGPSTARQLADRLALTPAAIRRHLTALLEDGTLETHEQRIYGQRGRGRPSKVFALTDAGRSEFRQAYDDLAIAAMRKLVETVGPQAARDLARDRVATLEDRFRELRATHPERRPIDVLVEALGEDGYAPSVRPVRSGEQLLQHHCPVAHVAAQFPVLCEIETRLFGDLLDIHVQRLATIAHGDGVCTTHVPKPIPTPIMLPTRK